MKKTILFFALITFVAFSSCNQEGLEEKDFEKDEWEKDWDDDEKEWDKECFEVVYPISYTMPDGSTISGDNEEALWIAIKTWYDNHPDVEEKPELVYPLDIKWEKDDEVQTISNEDEMELAKKECDWEKDWECFELVYPVSFTMPDGSTISGNDEEELWTAIKDWYDNHPDVEEKPELVYPVDIKWEEDDEIQTINNEDEMNQVKEDCEEWKDEEDCYELVYPISVTMPDGTTVSGNNEDELEDAIKTWYDNHPDIVAEPSFNYPIEIIFDDGTTQTINNDVELHDAEEDCND